MAGRWVSSWIASSTPSRSVSSTFVRRLAGALRDPSSLMDESPRSWTSIPSAPTFWPTRCGSTRLPELRSDVGDKQKYVSCFVGDLMVGIKVEVVQEVTSGSELTRVPLAPPVVSGLLNLRGQIVTTIDLRRCLQVVSRPADERPVHLILRIDDGCVGLVVDQVGDVLEVDDD